MESTYADRNHRPIADTVAESYTAVERRLSPGGNVVIPTFGLERAQEILYYLREGVDMNTLAPSIHVFLGSPMAISATEIFPRHRESCRPRIAELFVEGNDPLGPPGLAFAREKADSIAINRVTDCAIIMAGSGMATGGRVLHHLRHKRGVGHARAPDLDGTPEVTISGEPIRVRARIHTINGFSARADQAELLAWRRRVDPKRTFRMHGEEAAMNAFVAKLEDNPTERPTLGQRFEL
jgi:metallo-beta-lactamase family protein